MKNEYISYKNRGMLLENILNRTISYYISNKIAFFTKNNLNISFQSASKNKSNKIIQLNSSFIKSKSTVDYYGIYKGQYVTFEAKSTDEKFLPIANIKPHQHNHLKFISHLGGKAFYIIFFKKYSQIFLVNVDDIDYENKKSLSLKEAKEIGKSIEIIFPGVIDFLSLI